MLVSGRRIQEGPWSWPPQNAGFTTEAVRATYSDLVPDHDGGVGADILN